MRRQLGACLVALISVPAAANAQAKKLPIQQGSIQIGGTADISRTRSSGGGSGLTIAEAFPRIGYFVAKGLAVSANFRVRKVWADDQPGATNQGSTEWGIGPGVAYYVQAGMPRLFPFLSGRALHNRATSHADVGAASIDTRVTTDLWLLSGGALYMLGEHVGLTSEVFYQRNHNKVRNNPTTEITSSSTTYGVQWGISAFIF